ncbi:unnamed protein product [Dovyalis caffra]|uniref:gibberellin 3beta-dioxygenase n=1 Tax=Dovyalis caffra TaxID=77055 RepID=A0AAV1RED1_9ROSI|nr:unnamed protein product [Dovyalis caffra]
MASISESFKNNPIPRNHIVPLDFNNVLKLPDSHTWSLSADYPSIDPLDHEAVPIIDLTHPHALTLARKASENWGMFQVINHGIPIHLLQELELQTRTLFDLPANQKLQVVRSPDGITGYGQARIANFFNKQMWYEGFTIMGSPVQQASQLWPHDHAKFCGAMEDFQKEIKQLTERIIALMFKSLGLTQEDVKWLRPKSGYKHPQGVLQLNSYPMCPNPNQAMGLAPHTDSSLLTLLYQSNISGLQVFGDDDIGWVPVHPLPHALVVNVGDLMHIISNGRFKNALHRAVVNQTHHRLSIAYFYGPPTDIMISPLVDFDHPPLYRQVTWKDYLDAKATHFNEALDFIKRKHT